MADDEGRPLLSSRAQWPPSIKFLIWNEFCERFAFYGLRTILAFFLFEHLHLSENSSTEIVHLFIVACYAAPLLGAILSDGYMGKYRTILYLSALYSVGNWVLALAAVPNTDSGSTSLAFWITALGLFLISVGTGGIKPCVAAFGGDQIQLTMPDGPAKIRSQRRFFSMYYFAVNGGSVISTILTPILRADVSYSVAFAVPAALMVAALFIFWLGSKYYVEKPPEGNVFAAVGGVVADAVKLRFANNTELDSVHADEGGRIINGNDAPDGIGKENNNVVHWLDYARIKHGSEIVDDVKALLQVILVLLPAPIFWALFDQQSSKWIFQGRNMNGKISWLGGLVIQPDQMQAANPVLILMMIPLFDQIIYPCLENRGVSLKPIRRMLFGMVLGACAFLMSGVIQIVMDTRAATSGESGGSKLFLNSNSNGLSLSSRSLAESSMDFNFSQTSDQLSILWQIPQYVLVSAGEILFSITGLEFAYSQAPASMKSVIQALWLLTTSAGNIVTILIVAIIGDRLSQANEFFVFSGGCVLATLLMAWLSYGYVYKHGSCQTEIDQPEVAEPHGG